MDLTRPKTILICPAIILGDSQIPRVQGGCLSCEICQGNHRTGIVLAEHVLSAGIVAGDRVNALWACTENAQPTCTRAGPSFDFLPAHL